MNKEIHELLPGPVKRYHYTGIQSFVKSCKRLSPDETLKIVVDYIEYLETQNIELFTQIERILNKEPSFEDFFINNEDAKVAVMRLFTLERNIDKIAKRFCESGLFLEFNRCEVDGLRIYSTEGPWF